MDSSRLPLLPPPHLADATLPCCPLVLLPPPPLFPSLADATLPCCPLPLAVGGLEANLSEGSWTARDVYIAVKRVQDAEDLPLLDLDVQVGRQRSEGACVLSAAG
jgi:hypothetical protein